MQREVTTGQRQRFPPSDDETPELPRQATASTTSCQCELGNAEKVPQEATTATVLDSLLESMKKANPIGTTIASSGPKRLLQLPAHIADRFRRWRTWPAASLPRR